MKPVQFHENLSKLITIAQKTGHTVVLDTPHQTANFAGIERAQALLQFAAIVRQVARETGVPLIDSHAWSEQLWRTNVSLTHWLSDGVHLSPEGLKAKGMLMASCLLGKYPRVSEEQTISTDFPEWHVGPDVNNKAERPGTRYGRAVGGRHFRLAFYVERPNLDLYVAIPVFSGGGDVSGKIDGTGLVRNLSTLNPDMDINTGYSSDVDTMIAENLPLGFHFIELNSSVPALIYYARFAKSRAASLALTSLPNGRPTSGYVRYPVRGEFVMGQTAGDEGVLLTEVPISNQLRETSLQLTTAFAREEGFVLFASRFGTAGRMDAPRGGLYIYLGGTGHLTVREWKGASGYTPAEEVAEDDLSARPHSYTVTVSPCGTVSIQVDGGMPAVYKMRVPRTGGFIGFYKKTVGTMTISSLSIY